MFIDPQDPLAVAVTEAIRTGDVDGLRRLLRENSGLATAGIGPARDGSKGPPAFRSLLHIATDWPGHFPNGAATVAALVDAGADVNARFVGFHTETPLHWAASSDDVDVLEALLERGAHLEATGSVIDGGTALADAVAFGQWKAARRLVEEGARTTLWQAAALGLMDRVEVSFAGASAPGAHEVTNAFWCACHGGQRTAAEYLLARGADLDWIGHDGLTPLEAARRSGAHELVEWLELAGLFRARHGHFLFESGHHGELWLDLERLFLHPERVAPFAERLAERIARHHVTAVCGPLVEGAFVALSVAAKLGVPFTYSEPVANSASVAESPPVANSASVADSAQVANSESLANSAPAASARAGALFSRKYRVPPPLREELRGKRVAIINDVINAGSAVRATLEDLRSCGADPVVVGALMVLGPSAARFAADEKLGLETISSREGELWTPAECPLCKRGDPLT